MASKVVKMSMHNPEMYSKYIAFQKQDALSMLQKYGDRIKWPKNASIIDLGCGDGYVTSNIFKKHIPTDFKRLVGVDISKEMVDYASKKYGDERTSFKIMDLGGEVPKDLWRSFDHAFSSYAIQFVADQEKAFKNIFETLKADATCMLLFMGHTTLFDTFILLSQEDKWRTWLKDIDTVLGYHKMEDPASEVKRIMQHTGYMKIHVDAIKSSYEYETFDHLINMVESANLFHIPPENLKEFMKDFKRAMMDIKGVEQSTNKSDAVIMNYTKIIALGRKIRHY